MFKRIILFLFFLDFNWGQCDPNNDGQLNEMDIIENVNCIIDNCFDGSQCDFNSDGYLDIFDICATVDCIQSGCWQSEDLSSLHSSINLIDIPEGTFTMGETEADYQGPPGSYDAYSKNLAHFIRDVRKDLKAPKLPFVIGVMGAGGPIAKYGPDQKRYAGIHGEFRKAMAAPAKLPEFKGNVTAVLTENYWDGELSELVDRRGRINAKRRELSKDKSLNREQRDKALAELNAKLFTKEELKILELGVSNAAYHYLGSAKILGQIGKAFADALAEMN